MRGAVEHIVTLHPNGRRKPLPLKALMAAAALALLILSGCASTGAGNTTYAQWYGPSPVPDFGAASGGGVRIATN